MTKEYKCICGKEFKSQKSLSAHMASCKEHYLQRDGNLDNYNQRLSKLSEKGKTQGANYNKIRKELLIKNKQIKLNTWVSEEHRCEHCGKIMTEFYGSGRFCSKGCANSRVQTEDTKEKISKKLTKNICTETCKNCGKLLSFKNKTGYCKDCYIKLPKSEESKKKQSITMKSKGYPRWNIHRNEPSYAEKFFMEVLNNNSILYDFDHHVKNHKNHFYILDFYIEKNNIKIDLEIDGKQHKDPDRILHDHERDKYLKSKGYLIYRIEWNEINSDSGKQLMKNKINDFLIFYNTIER